MSHKISYFLIIPKGFVYEDGYKKDLTFENVCLHIHTYFTLHDRTLDSDYDESAD